MAVRNVDRLQDAWHAAGRYSRQPSPEAQRLVDEMFPPVPVDYTVKGYTAAYIRGVADRCIAALADEHLTAQEIAERVDVSIHSVVKALGVAVSNGLLDRTKASAGRRVRYWNPAVTAHPDQSEAA